MRHLGILRAEFVTQNLPTVYARCGLHTGDVWAGNIGSTKRFKFGLVGDAVNLASRLEVCNICVLVNMSNY